jgi:replicative DNA helicase
MEGRPINELPNYPDAESGLIGLALVRGEIPQGARSLSTADFYNANYRVLWSAFLELEEERQPIDPLAAYAIVKRNNPHTLMQVGAISATALGMPDCNEKSFVDKIRDASVRRHLMRKLSEGVSRLEKGEKGIVQSLRRELADLEFTEEAKGRFRPLSEIIDSEVIPALHKLRQGETGKIPTGFDAIDRVIGGGISLTDVLLIAGLPGGGKSALVLKLAANIAKQNIPVAFLSGEMSDKENGLRLLSQAAQVQNLNSAIHIYDDELTNLVQWAEAIKSLPIYFDSTTYDLQTISASLRGLVETHGIKVLVIDYIQLLKQTKNDRTKRFERITETSQEVKRLAMEYGIAVIEVAQFNREGAKSGTPGMHDLEGSSQLEKDTSLIFIIDREEQGSNVKLRIVKGRNSGTTEIHGRFDGWKLHFEF